MQPASLASRSGLCRVLFFLLLLGGVTSAPPAAAQIERPDEAPDPDAVPRATSAYAITNARIVVAPGEVVENGTVVVRDGLIEAVGPDVAVPYDAAPVEGDSLTVYAGFISGLSHAGIPKNSGDDGEEAPEVERPGAPPPEVAGIQPDRTARALLDPEERTIGKLREAGFTTAHTVPRSGMLPGRGAVIELAGDSPGAMVLRPDASVFAQFEGAGGVYPATDMAVIATMRQLFRETERRRKIEQRYEQEPQGLARPRRDDLHAAFYPVLNGEKPVFFFTEGALDIHRAISLKEELGFPLALGGLQQSFAAVETLTDLQQSEGGRDTPLFLSLALPEEPEDADQDTSEAPPDSARADSVRPGPVGGAVADTTNPGNLGVGQDTSKAVTPSAPGSAFIRDFRTHSYEDTDSEHENLLARRALYAARYYANAATLREAGLRFGFSTKEADAGDLLGNLRKMVDHGLSERDALAALTTDAAEMLGLSRRLGTVEAGKIADLVVTAGGSLFDDDTSVRHVFVDGKKFTYEAANGSGSDAPPAEGVEPAGTWEYEISSPQGNFTGTLTLEGDPGDLSGTIVGPQGEEQSLDDPQLDGSDLSFSFDGGRIGTLSVTATIEGDAMEGTVTVPGFGGLPLEATRTSGPERR